MPLSVVAIRRARRYSPGGHESSDWLILKESAELVARTGGHSLRYTTEEEVGDEPPRADLVLNMCQGPEANARLSAAEGGGTLIVNRPQAALDCLRYRLLPQLRAAGIPVPESVERDTSTAAGATGEHERLWIKRADVHATEPGDVVSVRGEAEVRAALDAFRRRGLSRAIVQQHLEGAVVKFYCVGDAFFHHLVTSGDPAASLDVDLLRLRARQCGEALGLDVYGGECVTTADGRLPVIDVNDWPSFAPCRGRAARAIAHYVLERAEAPA